MRRGKTALAVAVALAITPAALGAAAVVPTPAAADEATPAAAADAQGFVIENGVLTGYTGTAADIVIPDGVTEIADDVFGPASGHRVTSVTFPDSVVKIGCGAFSGTEIKELRLPRNLVSIGSGAFAVCDNLSYVWIPKSLQTVEGRPDDSREEPFGESYGTMTVEFEEGTTHIPDSLFDNAWSLEEITLPDTVTEIGSDAFRDSGLTSIELPTGLQSIGDGAFSGCQLTEVALPDGVRRIGSGAFSGADINELSIPASLTECDESFAGCTVGKVEFQDGVTVVPAELFGGSGSTVAEIVFPDTLTEIGHNAFSGCKGLTNVELPEGVTTLGYGAFADCTDLTDVFVPSTLAECMKDQSDWSGWVPPFSGCDALENVTFGEGIATIPEALLARTGIAELHVPGTIIVIEESAFDQCANLKDLYIPASVTSIGRSDVVVEGQVLIHCEEGSYAQQYAKQNGIPCTADLEHEHAFSAWELASEATCTEPRVERRTCSCGIVETREVGEALGHDFSGEWVIDWESTCTEPGQGSRHCTRCDEVSDKMEIPALGHAFSSEWTVDAKPTCIEAGEKSHHCTREGCDTRTDVTEIPALGHDFSGEWVTDVEPTCTDPGERSKYCERCGERGEIEAIPALGHDFGAWVVDTPATYFSEGAQHRSCSRCDARENEVIPKLMPDFEAHPDYTFAKLHVVDAQSLESIDGATITVTNDAGDEYTLATEQGGQAALFVPAGTYYLTVENDGYQPRGFEYTFETGSVNVPDIGISTESLVQGELTATEMTAEEMEEAGINPNLPGNNHVFKYEVTLEFTDGLEFYELPIVNLVNDNGDRVGGYIGTPGHSGSFTFTQNNKPTTVSQVGENFYIVVQGETKWTKEMFHVQLVAVNFSKTDTMTDTVATLELPDGLSLAQTNAGQSLLQNVGTVGSEEVRTVDWYVAGDKPGDYNLKAVIDTTFQPLGDKHSYTFETANPLHVYAGTDMQMTVHVSDAAYYGKPYVMIYELENVSNHTIYNVEHAITDVSQYVGVPEYAWTDGGVTVANKDEFEKLDTQHLGEDGKITAEEFKPGDKLFVLVETEVKWKSPLQELKDRAGDLSAVMGLASMMCPPAGAASTALSLMNYIDVRYYLINTMVETLEGSTAQIPVVFDVQHQPGVSLTDKFIDELIKKIIGKATGEAVKFELGDDSYLYDFPRKVFKGASTLLEAKPSEEGGEYFAWVESADGSSNVLQVEAQGAERTEDGKLVLKGTQEISVTALNSGKAYLVIDDGHGHVTRKQFEVAEEFPGYDRIKDALTDPTGFLEFKESVLSANTLVTDDMLEWYKEAGMTLSFNGEALKAGERIPTGAVIVDDETGEERMILVSGDSNSDGEIDVRDVYTIDDGSTARAGLTEAQRKASDFNGDGAADRTDSLYLLDYLTDADINSRGRAAMLAAAPAGARTATISLASLTEGYENVRGVQVDLLDLAAQGMTDVAGSNGIAATDGAADFTRTVYNAEGDYLRTIAASFDGHLDTANGQITVTYNADADEVTLPAVVYIVTDDGVETVQRDLALTAAADEPEGPEVPGGEEPENPGGETPETPGGDQPGNPDDQENPDDPAGAVEQEKENLNSALDAFKETVANSSLSDEQKKELAAEADKILEQLAGASDAEAVDQLQEQFSQLQDSYKQAVDQAEAGEKGDPSVSEPSSADAGDEGSGAGNGIPATGDYVPLAAGGLAVAAAALVGSGAYLRRRKRS